MPWRFLIGGFSMGVIAAAIVYYMMSPSAPRRPAEPIPETQRPPASATIDTVREERPTPAPAPKPAPKPAAQPEPEEEKFKFWEMLQNYEVIVPEAEERVEKTKPQAPISKPGNYLLQIGAFRRYADADRLKAKLALQGIECYIEKVTINDDQYHRVRIGPETQLKQVNALRRRLNEQDINVLVIRIPAP